MTGNNLAVVTPLRLIAWNCRSGSVTTRLAELDTHPADLVFLQECSPDASLPLAGQVLARRVGPQKGIAWVSLNPDYHLTGLDPRTDGGRAFLAVTVTGPVTFTALGIWAQGPKYVDDVLRTLDAYADILRAGPAVVLGDLNSGTDLGIGRASTKGHSRIVNLLADLGLVSAYHAFHNLEQGKEKHPTYRHQFKESQPWHIDFCFVPAAWTSGLVAVDTIDGQDWAKSSDHLPLRVSLSLSDCCGAAS
jgi:hypothetical protein